MLREIAVVSIRSCCAISHADPCFACCGGFLPLGLVHDNAFALTACRRQEQHRPALLPDPVSSNDSVRRGAKEELSFIISFTHRLDIHEMNR